VGDLCSLPLQLYQEGGWFAQQIWSNARARTGNENPCTPSDPAVPYFNVSPAPPTIQNVAAGRSTTLVLTGWSTMGVPSWSLNLAEDPSSTFTPSTNLSAGALNNGQKATLTLGVPPGTPHQSYAILYVTSTLPALYYTWPVAVVVP
jgi:hypothetical protein